MAIRPGTRPGSDTRRSQIIEEALRLIGEQGYRGFTIQALAQACGLSNAGLLHHFGSKDGMLLAVLDEIERREILVVGSLTERSGTNHRKLLEDVLSAIATSAVANPQVTRFRVQLLAESIAPDHPAHEWFKLRQRQTRDLFTRLTMGWARDPSSTALHLQAVLNGMTLEWVHASRGFDLVENVKTATGAIMADAAE